MQFFKNFCCFLAKYLPALNGRTWWYDTSSREYECLGKRESRLVGRLSFVGLDQCLKLLAVLLYDYFEHINVGTHFFDLFRFF